MTIWGGVAPALWLFLAVPLALAACGGSGRVPVAASAPDTVTVAGSCSECEIEMERVAILGGADLPFEFGSFTSIAVMSDGRYLAGLRDEGQLALFNADGTFERLIGRRGQGPGEFEDIGPVAVLPGDTVYVRQFVGLIKLGPDFEYISRHTVPIPARLSGWAVLPGGGSAWVAVELQTDAPPNRIHIVNRDFELERSFARAPRTYDPYKDMNEVAGALAYSSRHDGLWYAKWNEYALHLFVDGEPTMVIERDTDWFEPWEGPDEGGTQKRPTLAVIAEGPDGLLTTITTVADTSFAHRAAFYRDYPPGELSSRRYPRQLLWDAIVEVIDPDTGEVLSHTRSDDPLYMPVGGDGSLLYAVREDVIGRYRVYVYRVGV